MHAYLLITKKPVGEAEVRKLAPDIELIIPFSVEKIADTKELIRQTSISYSKKTAFLLNDFDQASVEAQNAFLKSLEEAQENVVYILSAEREEGVLPTIISRCRVIRTKSSYAKASDGQGSEINFETISKITKREEAIEYLENLLSGQQFKLPENAKLVRAADTALTRIKANANPTLQLTWFMTQVSLH